MTEAPITIGSHVTPNAENIVARPQNNDIRFVHEGERFEIIALGCGLAICRPLDGSQADDLSIQTADLKVW